MAHPWPLFDLRVQTPHLELRLPTDDDLVALLEVARGGVHEPEAMPFLVPWTDLPSPMFERSFLRFHWDARASWSPTAWRLPLAVVRDDRPLGVQELVAAGFPLRRTVSSGSWLGRRYQRQGVGTEMRAAILYLAFEGLGALAAESGALEGNDASARISAKLGYRPNGEILVAPRGTPVVEHRFRLTLEDWTKGLVPVVIENLDACRDMFGIG